MLQMKVLFYVVSYELFCKKKESSDFLKTMCKIVLSLSVLYKNPLLFFHFNIYIYIACISHLKLPHSIKKLVQTFKIIFLHVFSFIHCLSLAVSSSCGIFVKSSLWQWMLFKNDDFGQF